MLLQERHELFTLDLPLVLHGVLRLRPRHRHQLRERVHTELGCQIRVGALGLAEAHLAAEVDSKRLEERGHSVLVREKKRFREVMREEIGVVVGLDGVDIVGHDCQYAVYHVLGSTSSLVVRRELGCLLGIRIVELLNRIELQRREALYARSGTERTMCVAVHSSNLYKSVQVLGSLLEVRRQLLAVPAPRRIRLEEDPGACVHDLRLERVAHDHLDRPIIRHGFLLRLEVRLHTAGLIR
mmetsp:Transcript_47190/g.111264  ORF Transcript_47190/g.111264 Transcript_47190/m.111264 type:complete len:240 (-) Transcript_47190:896-1615(-)